MERQRWTWVLLAAFAIILFGAACSLDGGKGKREQELRQILEHLIPDSASMSEIEWGNCEEGGAPSSCVFANLFWPRDTTYNVRRDAILERAEAEGWKLTYSDEGGYLRRFYLERGDRYLLVAVPLDELVSRCMKPTPQRNGVFVTTGCYDQLRVGPLKGNLSGG